MEEDEDVVFENSALHQHLKGAGFSEADLGTETLQGLLEEEAGNLDDQDINPAKLAFTFAGMKDGAKEAAKKAWTWIKGGDTWNPEVQHLHQKYADDLTDHVLKCSAMEDEDNLFLESFGNACLQDRMEEPTEGLVNQIFMQMGILGIAVAYGGFRLIYLKSDDPVKYIWYIDVLSVLLTIAALLPATVRFTSAGRVIGKLGTLKQKVLKLLGELERLHRLCRKTVRLVQEAELVARGFTMVSPMSPVSRLEQGGLHHALRQCPQLRKTLFHSCREVMLRHKKATAELLKVYPENVELEGMSNYLANLPLEQYGPFILLQGPEKEEELKEVTDNYSLSALKAIVHLCNVHVSEFLRVLAVGLLVKAEDKMQLPGFPDLAEICSNLHTDLHKQVRLLDKQYVLHKYVVMEKDNPSKPMLQRSNVATAYVAVHSLSLHLQAALKKVQKLEDELEPHCEEEDLQVASAFSGQLLKNLEVTKLDLEACKDCWEEGVSRLEKLAGKQSAKSDISKENSHGETSSNEETREGKDPIPLFEMGDLIIEDQVFEAYTDPNEKEPMDWGDDGFLSEEERAKKKQEKQEALRVLSELRTVIAVRALDREDRERKALDKMYPERTAELASEQDTSSMRSQCELQSQGDETDARTANGNNCESQDACGSSTNDRDATYSVELISECDGVDDAELPPSNNACGDYQAEASSGSDCVEFSQAPRLPDLKTKLTKIPGADLPFTATVAAMAAARSQQVAALSMDTFGDDSSSDDEE